MKKLLAILAISSMLVLTSCNKEKVSTGETTTPEASNNVAPETSETTTGQ